VPAPVPDFTAAELDLVAAVVRQRDGKPVPIEPAESELQLDAADALVRETGLAEVLGIDAAG
jgi:hypothetical protein